MNHCIQQPLNLHSQFLHRHQLFQMYHQVHQSHHFNSQLHGGPHHRLPHKNPAHGGALHRQQHKNQQLLRGGRIHQQHYHHGGQLQPKHQHLGTQRHHKNQAHGKNICLLYFFLYINLIKIYMTFFRWDPSYISFDSQSESSTTTTTTTTTSRPSTTTPSWWHPETTSYHKPGNVQPDSILQRPTSNSQSGIKEPNKSPQIGDLSFLSISSFPHFEHFVKPNSKTFVKKPEYEFLHHFPAELLQDIENEELHERKGTDQEIANDFRRIYDDFFARIRVFAPISGKKRVPPTRPYVLFLIFYDLCKREAKRLNLQEFTVCFTSLHSIAIFLK